MKFAKRMDPFSEGIFSRLLELKKERLEHGQSVIDLSVGAPNIPRHRILYQPYVKRQQMPRTISMH